MSADHERFAKWDAAYALGALSPSDRAEYEAHLVRCEECRDAVAEIVPAVGLLSRLSAEDAGSIRSVDTADEARDDAGAKLLDIARARRRTRRRVTWAAVGIAAALAVAVPVGFVALSPRPSVEMALEQVVDVPVNATVALTPVAWGTKIEMECEYAADAPDYGWTYVLTVIGEDGTATDLSTWKVEPGRAARLSAGTALALGDIAAVEIRNGKGDVVLRHDVG